ncbi:MAG: hypothetical protein JWQ14_538 [Adhaeribacter sp.]|nr:hypothetical protein [Adhaeribacter sp.]
MKRPSTASAGLNFLNQGFTIELDAQAVGPFLRYCERNKPGFGLQVTYENDIAILKAEKQAVEFPSVQHSIKSNLEKAGLTLANRFFKSRISPA